MNDSYATWQTPQSRHIIFIEQYQMIFKRYVLERETTKKVTTKTLKQVKNYIMSTSLQ